MGGSSAKLTETDGGDLGAVVERKVGLWLGHAGRSCFTLYP